jgi:hypothetical protein
MKFASLDHFDISPWRIMGVGGSASGASALIFGAVIGGALGPVGSATEVVVAILVLYIVVTTPRRILDSQRVAQARESVLLSVAASACLSVTGSRSRTLTLLRSTEDTLAKTLSEITRQLLLGNKAEMAVMGASKNLASYSAIAALYRMAVFRPRAFDAGDEESTGIAKSSELSRETKIPIFMTVCFFAPIMLLLYAVFFHLYDTMSLGELAAFEFVIIDLAFYMSASDRAPT